MTDRYKEKDYDYLLKLLMEGNIPLLEEAREIIDDFPNGVDPFIQRHWITNAIDVGSLTSIKWILSNGVDLTFRDEEGFTPLLSAIDREQPDKYEVLQLLIDGGAPIDRKGTNDWTPLHMAAVREDIEAMKVLLRNGADRNIRTNIDNYATPLEEAKSMGRWKSVEFLQDAE